MSQDNFVWTDALVAEYSLTNQKMTLFEFKRFIQEREEKTKRDWEILKLRIGNTEHIVDADKSDGTAREYHIYSVKRLSDSEVFSIGDEVLLKYGEKAGPIKQIEIDDTACWLNGGEVGNLWTVRLDFAKKVVKPKPLFTDEELLNTTLFSLKDILDKWYSWDEFKSQCLSHSSTFYREEVWHRHPLFQRFKELAKEKLSK